MLWENDQFEINCEEFEITVKKLLLQLAVLYWAKLQNTGPLIYILLNNNSAYCVILRSSKGFDTCKIGGPKWPCIL